ncbi:MAG TPA: lyase family protein [Nevskiaceae bacterium]|nr:lyase family protein [Nevskiaceae bacterium]
MLKPFKLPPVRTALDFSALDPLDARYYDPQVAQYLSEGSRIVYQAYAEAALAHTLADYGICSRKAAASIEAAARKVTPQAVYSQEQVTKHDIKALVNCIKKGASNEAAVCVHFGATSYDIICTAQALQMRAAMANVVIPRLKKLLQTLLDITETYVDTVQIGRTHGQHAVPVTFGFAMSEYVSRLGTSTQALQALTAELHGKFSGAVGAYNALSVFVDKPMDFEKALLAKLGLQPAPYSTQIVPPEGMIRLIDELTIAAGIMANLAHDMRHLQRSEIAEVREKFEKGQTGSSTMAHKRNPWNFENVISMAKQVTAQSVNANLNLSSEHQRDLTDSASSRFYTIPLASVAAMAQRLDKVMNKLEVDEQAMQRNLQLTGGAIAAEPFYLLLAKHGHPQAHEASKALAHHAMQQSIPLYQAIAADAAATLYWKKFSRKEQHIITHPEQYYTGLASAKAKAIVRYWKQRLQEVKV